MRPEKSGGINHCLKIRGNCIWFIIAPSNLAARDVRLSGITFCYKVNKNSQKIIQ